ncbi:hypothetical protein D3C73_1606180 [compost metagenome]
MQRQNLQLRGKARRFVEPVRNQAGWHYSQCREIKSPSLLFRQQMRQGLQGFPQPHVVAQNAADF